MTSPSCGAKPAVAPRVPFPLAKKPDVVAATPPLRGMVRRGRSRAAALPRPPGPARARLLRSAAPAVERRSEEHTSELQSRRDLVCRLLLEKKKTTQDCPF